MSKPSAAAACAAKSSTGCADLSIRFHLCHCSQCRRSTGSAHAANIFTSEDRLEWLSGTEFVKRYTSRTRPA